MWTDEQFEQLEQELSSHISALFDGAVAKFILSDKNNSFEFGIEKDNNYISFCALSTAEKCMYMLSLAAVIAGSANSGLNLLLIDDSFDSTDEKNLAKISEHFNSSGVQIITAGIRHVPGSVEILLS